MTWGWTAPDPATWGILAAAGFVAYIGQMLVTSGYSLAPSAQLVPYSRKSVKKNKKPGAFIEIK